MTKKNEQIEKIRALDRRTFIKAGSLLTLGSMLMPTGLFAKRTIPGPDAAGGCVPTTDDILGPFYLPGSPTTTMVADANEPGDRLFISGAVLSSDCMTPVEGVRIEVWQADDNAVYDPGPVRLRATMFSDANGQYAYETIMPGPYLNGGQFRPSHIHYRVNKVGFPELITQLYFDGDPYIAQDPWASQADAAQRIIPLNPLGGGQQEGVFDLVLDGFVGIKPNRYGTEGDLLPIHPNPMKDRCSIHFNVFRSAHVAVCIFDTNGRELITLLDAQFAQGRFTTQWNGETSMGERVSAGNYVCQLRMEGNGVKTQRIVVQ